MTGMKLFMLLLGCKPKGRHTEQHDIFFGAGKTVKDLVPDITAFWPEPNKVHIDAWREVTEVDGYSVRLIEKKMTRLQKNIEYSFHGIIICLLCLLNTEGYIFFFFQKTTLFKQFKKRTDGKITGHSFGPSRMQSLWFNVR